MRIHGKIRLARETTRAPGNIRTTTRLLYYSKNGIFLLSSVSSWSSLALFIRHLSSLALFIFFVAASHLNTRCFTLNCMCKSLSSVLINAHCKIAARAPGNIRTTTPLQTLAVPSAPLTYPHIHVWYPPLSAFTRNVHISVNFSLPP